MTRHAMPWGLKALVGCVLVAALGLVLAAGLGRRDAQPDSSLPVTQQPDRPAPALTGTTLSGQRFDLERLRGKVVVLNVMASWCAPCRAELPVLAHAEDRFGGPAVEFVGIAMRDDPADTRQLLADTGTGSMTVLLDPDGVGAVDLGVRGVPETFVVDRTGSVRLHAFGPVTDAWFDRWLSPLVAS